MLFTMELEGVGRSYRLQKDGNWRRMKNDYSLLESDFKTSDPSEIMRLTPYGEEIELEGVLYKISPTTGLIGGILSGSSTVYRRDFPDVIPSKEELRRVIATGDDEQTNSLILNLEGHFELRQRPPFDTNKNDPTIVIRHETFSAGNDYVGIGAAQDDDHIDELFNSSLKGWINHLKTGKTHEYSDSQRLSGSKELLNEIELLRSQWVPFY